MKSIFNLIRNLSLAFVIVLIGGIYYYATNQAVATDMLNKLIQKEEPHALYQKEEQQDDAAVFHSKVNEPAPDLYKHKKLKIAIKNGYTYLRSSQIMYAYVDSIVQLVTIDEEKIFPNITLTDLYKTIRRSEDKDFLKTKSAIINCNYVRATRTISEQNMSGYHYTYEVNMEDGEKTAISKVKYEELGKIMERLTLVGPFFVGGGGLGSRQILLTNYHKYLQSNNIFKKY